jgi:hypothetical protein
MWDEDWLPPEDKRERLEAAVYADMESLIEEDQSPSDLCFHHCMPDGDGAPWVFVYGEENSNAFHCLYDSEPPKWNNY